VTAESIPGPIPGPIFGALPRTGPLDAWADRFAALPAGLHVAAEPFVTMVDVRAAEPSGLPAPNSWTPHGDGRASWLGPDEWLVTSASRTAAELAAGLPGTVVDVSAQRTTLHLTGTHARDLLATGCALDLHPRAFPPGSAAQTLLGQTGVLLLALEAGFALLVRSSFARYTADWLLDAAVEFGPEGP
jgi:sarcosine oxidase, subunit gamma